MTRENCVVISDAMRYEVGEELLGRIRNLDRYDAEIEPALASLPSYTQLGMASLLPNKEIRIACEPACKQADVVMNSGFPSCGSLKSSNRHGTLGAAVSRRSRHPPLQQLDLPLEPRR